MTLIQVANPQKRSLNLSSQQSACRLGWASECNLRLGSGDHLDNGRMSGRMGRVPSKTQRIKTEKNQIGQKIQENSTSLRLLLQPPQGWSLCHPVQTDLSTNSHLGKDNYSLGNLSTPRMFREQHFSSAPSHPLPAKADLLVMLKPFWSFLASCEAGLAYRCVSTTTGHGTSKPLPSKGFCGSLGASVCQKGTSPDFSPNS